MRFLLFLLVLGIGIDLLYLGWGRKSYFFCYCLLVIMWFLLFLLVLEIGYIILLRHSLGLPYNYLKLMVGTVLATPLRIAQNDFTVKMSRIRYEKGSKIFV